jgi:hypothetical protein
LQYATGRGITGDAGPTRLVRDRSAADVASTIVAVFRSTTYSSNSFTGCNGWHFSDWISVYNNEVEEFDERPKPNNELEIDEEDEFERDDENDDGDSSDVDLAIDDW